MTRECTASSPGRGKRRPWAPPPLTRPGYALLALALALVLALVLAGLGRPLTGPPGLAWLGEAEGAGGSQAALDAYAILHAVSGMALRVALRPRTAHWPRGWLMLVALASSAVWEMAENTPFVIARFGQAPGAPDYAGDSILNAAGDTFCLVLGFALASRLPARAVAGLLVVADLAMMAAGLDGIASAALRLLA